MPKVIRPTMYLKQYLSIPAYPFHLLWLSIGFLDGARACKRVIPGSPSRIVLSRSLNKSHAGSLPNIGTEAERHSNAQI
ncbi:hypothetical protein F5890DRAFT_1481809 [Lentinula detonsa]|uniref:Uncharacterized protein n=1 Tax=Lentinula detonsa TaxID=2804962 RepID=A0AA38QAK1_9AGAR|nr:hypothetical protein F5890DRAFT_1481809 [Lentinula detonsa]